MFEVMVAVLALRRGVARARSVYDSATFTADSGNSCPKQR